MSRKDDREVVEDWWLRLVDDGWLYPALFLLTVADAFLVVLPSEIAVAALAALWVSTGSPPVLAVAAVGAAGAVVGDSACYAIGRWIGKDRWSWQRRPLVARAIGRAEAGIGSRPALLILTARYVPYARIAVNLTFGSTGFAYRRFLPLSIAAGSAWAGYHSATGAFFGTWFSEHPALAVVAAIAGATTLGLAIDLVASARSRRRQRAGAGHPVLSSVLLRIRGARALDTLEPSRKEPSVRVGVTRELQAGERRVAATPETVQQLTALGLEVAVEKGAGLASGYSDAAYQDAGATTPAKLALGGLDVLLHVRPLAAATAKALKKGTVTIGLASPATELPTVAALAKAGVTSFALELVPRISRAQSMDALSSQALVSGYRAVLEAALRYPRFFPLYMTAAGTIPPAKVLVLGAGVAGLQAIGTAKRLGARVSANDIRAASADEVRSMGGTFITLDLDAAAEGTGGYARELAEDRAKRQRELLAPHVAAADVLITTAAIPGRAAPLLVTKKMVQGMRAGSIVIDLAAESGGNVEGVVAGEDLEVKVDGGTVTLVGLRDAPSAIPSDASRLYAKNVANLLALMTVEGAVSPDFSDEVIAGACLTKEGSVVHEPTAQLLRPAPSETTGKGAK